jgi:hypothetical protein
MPARHKSLRTICFSGKFQIRRLWSTKEGVGETSGQTAGSTFRRVRSFGNRSGRRSKFSSFGADLKIRNFTGDPKAQVKSGPDVFADALVPMAAAVDARRCRIHQSLTSSFGHSLTKP